jgi:radical SAM superfamily enzyme YgiQ (UPF0313 family)
LPDDVVLISTYELGHAPMQLASPLGFLARAGVAARGIDVAVEALDEAAVAGARLVAVAVPMHTALRLALRLLPRLRALNPAAHVCFYGLYAVLHEAELRAAGVDSVLGGEYEEALVALAQSIVRAPSPSPSPSPPASTPSPSPPASTRAPLVRLQFASPRRETLPPPARYARLLLPSGETRLAGYVEASRGCLHQCRHCPIPPVYDGRFFVVPRELVLEDVRAQVAAGARHVTFGDADFWNGPRHAMELVRALHREFPDVTFDATIKIEHLLKHREQVPELAALGCAFVVSAVETIDDRVLALLDKGHTRADVDAALALCDAAGLPLRPSLVPFTPWETLAGYRALLAWIDARGLADRIDPVHLTIRLLIPRGSKLLELDDVRALVGAFELNALSYAWQHPDPRMDALQRAAFGVVSAAGDDDPRVTIARVRELADAVARGESIDDARSAAHPRTAAQTHAHAHRHAHAPPRSPRLSESWFC